MFDLKKKIKLYINVNVSVDKFNPESLTQGDEFFHVVKRLLILLGNH